MQTSHTTTPGPRFLLVKLRHIGDTLILTPVIRALRSAHPEAQIDVLVRKGCQHILVGCPGIDTIYTTAAPEKQKRAGGKLRFELEQILAFRRNRYDYAFDFSQGDRGRLIVGLSGAKHRVTNLFGHPLSLYLKPLLNACQTVNFHKIHQVESDYQLVAQSLGWEGEPGKLIFEKEKTKPTSELEQVQNFALIHITTRWRRKEWPFENWKKVTAHLLEHFEYIVLDVGPDEREMSEGRRLAAEMGDRVICPSEALTFAQLAGLLYRTQLFVGLDTVSMHLAAACDAPMVAIFGPIPSALWHPWKTSRAKWIEPVKEAGKEFKENGSITSITPEQVIAACGEIAGYAVAE